MTIDGSFAISKGLGGDHKYELHTTKVLANVWSIRLIDLIYRYLNNSYFKRIKGRDPLGMMMIRL